MLSNIRAVIFYFGYSIFTILQGSLGLLIAVCLPPKLRNDYIALWCRTVLWWLKVTCGVTHTVEGDIPKGTFVLAGNHQSPWETIYLQFFISPVSTVLKKELLKIPFFGWAMAMMNPIAINREDGRGAAKQVLKEGKEHIESGFSVLIFPEGTRQSVGKLGRFNRGAANLAVAAKAPILPFAHNAGKYWPAKALAKTPGNIRFIVGPVMHPEEMTARELNQKLELWVQQATNELQGTASDVAASDTQD
ncbi:MAG: 1-acyl-sn-glycerol-3-phosphate acyltransferase [Pseudomonadales bacterium]|nr:1-acyl-sn-glycerol-3-phosphate acyltransferase [Pseudomonadales bacterium]